MTLTKAYVSWGDRIQTSTPGQVPYSSEPSVHSTRIDPEVEKMLMTPPPEWSTARFFAKPVVSAHDVVDGLGLSLEAEENLSRMVSSCVNGADSVATLKRDLMHSLHTEGYPGAMRQILVSRAATLWLHRRRTEKAVFVLTPDQLKKGGTVGGSYHKRVTHQGKHKYYYDEKSYNNNAPKVIDGKKTREKFVQGAVHDMICASGESGCGFEDFSSLSKRFGAKAVYSACKDHHLKGKITYKNKRFTSVSTGAKDTKVKKARFVIPRKGLV